MGLNVDRFVSQINPNFICAICLGVLDDPVQDAQEHAFCRVCIYNALNRDLQCPIDRTPLIRQELEAPSRLLTSLLQDLDVHCDYRERGCLSVLKYSQLKSHVLNCSFNAVKTFACPNGCGNFASKLDLEAHSCILTLQKFNRDLQTTLFEATQHFKGELKRLEQKVYDLQHKINTIYRDDYMEMKCFEFLSNLRLCPRGNIRDITAIEGDFVSHMSIRESLEELKCPQDLVEKLILNCNEMNWSDFMSSANQRSINENELKSLFGYDIAKCGYVILILPYQNRHVPLNFIKEPGILVKLKMYDSFVKI